MAKNYVEQRDGVYRIAGTRISLDSVVYAFRDGQTAEGIAQSFPVLDLEQIYGAIAFYLSNQAEIDAYLEREEVDYEALRKATREAESGVLSKARRRPQTTRGLVKVRYQADADLNRTILLAVARLEPAIDFQTAHAAGLEGVDDPDVLGLAAATGRILVTHDRRTMPRHFAEFLAAPRNRIVEETKSQGQRGRGTPQDKPKGKVIDLMEALKADLVDSEPGAELDCPGVLIVPQKLPVAVAAEELVLIWALTEAEDWVDRICAIPL